jgi:hypothetical protein
LQLGQLFLVDIVYLLFKMQQQPQAEARAAGAVNQWLASSLLRFWNEKKTRSPREG